MGSRSYYTLIGSLPYLIRFDQAERLPINVVRLEERLRMLEPDDAVLVERTAAFLAWQRQPVERTDAEVVSLFDDALEWASVEPGLLDMIEFRMNIRTVMAALRRRNSDKTAPEPGEAWGVGPLVRQIERYWDDPDFKLGQRLPWIQQAREYVESGETLALEKLLMDLSWNQADMMAQKDAFAFDALLAYLFKWDILNRWLSYDSGAAKARFEKLVAEVIGEHERIFD